MQLSTRSYPAADFFFLRFRQRGHKRGVRSYVTTHVWILAEFGGACSRAFKVAELAFCQGVAFRPV